MLRMKAGRNQALNARSKNFSTTVAEQFFSLRIYQHNLPGFVNDNHRIRSRFDQVLEALLQGLKFFCQPRRLRDVFRDEQKPQQFARAVPAWGENHASTKALTVFPYPRIRSFPFAIAQRRFQHGRWLSSRNVLRRVQDSSVGPTDNFLCRIPVNPMGSLIPQNNLAIRVLANDGVLRGRLKNVGDECECLLRAAEKRAIEKRMLHFELLPAIQRSVRRESSIVIALLSRQSRRKAGRNPSLMF